MDFQAPECKSPFSECLHGHGNGVSPLSLSVSTCVHQWLNSMARVVDRGGERFHIRCDLRHEVRVLPIAGDLIDNSATDNNRLGMLSDQFRLLGIGNAKADSNRE